MCWESLLDQAALGQGFVIAREGHPLVRVLPWQESTPASTRRFDGLAGALAIPDDFDRMGAMEIAALFEGEPEPPPLDDAGMGLMSTS